MNHLKKIPALVGILLLSASLTGAENSDGELGMVSSGNINLTLEVNQSVAAGFLRTNLDDPDSEFQRVESYRVVTNLQQNGSTTIPFCIISSEGGAFVVDTNEQAFQENMLESEFGARIPFEVAIGQKEQGARYRAVQEQCTEGDTIPITIRAAQALSGREIGRLKGKFNLLVKSE